ncbi:zinc finger protein 615-like [Calliphora vicina]|uniref:zinc finger protein 615-like n=1 Tax=Calliphora vicina TaxID=7373 RepID=UPI00325ADE0A
MATKMLNMQDYTGYIKCGEILKSPLPNYQYPFILKCYQCDKINFILESFIIHIQEHCNDGVESKESVDIKIASEDEVDGEPIENPLIKIETIIMEVDDPLIVIKDEVIEEIPQEDVETHSNTREDNEDFEDYSSNTDDDFQTDDAESDDEEIANKSTKKKKKKSALPPTIEKFIKSKPKMQTLIELYKNQPNLWNKDLPFYRFRDKRQSFLEETTKDLNNKLNSKYTCKEVSDIITYIYRKHREDFKRLRLYEEDDKTPKDMKYKRCWFFDDLYFLRPKTEMQLQKLDANLPDLTTEQVTKIIQIYREFPHLWNTNLVEFICTNKRHEAYIEMMKSLETNMNINISVTVLEEYLRTIHYYFSREKRLRKQKKIDAKLKNPAEDYYEHLLYLYDHEGPFNCSECNRLFAKPLGFKVHKSTHDDSIPFTCSQCNKEFKTIQSYTVHAKRHFEDLEFACTECNRKFVAYADLRVHLLTHSGDRPYFCEICGTSYRHVQCFKRHQRRHEKRYTHTCHICSKGYYSKDRYDDHMNSHMNIRQHICQLCGKGFITSRALKTHSVTHEDARNHACKLCGKTFKLKIGVLQHMRTHGSRFEIEDKN